MKQFKYIIIFLIVFLFLGCGGGGGKTDTEVPTSNGTVIVNTPTTKQTNQKLQALLLIAQRLQALLLIAQLLPIAQRLQLRIILIPHQNQF